MKIEQVKSLEPPFFVRMIGLFPNFMAYQVYQYCCSD